MYFRAPERLVTTIVTANGDPINRLSNRPKKGNAPVEPVTHVGQVSPLHPSLVEWAQQSAADQSEDGRGQRQPLLRVTLPFVVSGGPAVFGGEEAVFFFSSAEVVVSRDPPLSEVLAADVLEDGEAQRVEQEVPDLVLLLHEAAGGQAEGVSDGAGQQQNIQLGQPPLATAETGRRLRGGWGEGVEVQTSEKVWGNLNLQQ